MARSGTINEPRGGKKNARADVAVGYCRRSTDRQEQSIPDQKKAIEKYALEHQLKLIRFYVDDAISGTSTEGRKAFQQLIEDAKAGGCEFGLVIVYDVKRFGRIDNDEAGHWRYILKTNGVEVLYASENFTGDRTDDLLRPVKQWQAREESKDLSKVVIRGLLTRSSLPPTANHKNGSESGLTRGGAGGGGWWMGGSPPFGYDLRYESSGGEFLFYLRFMPDGTKQMFDRQWKLIRTLARRESVTVSRRDRCKLVLSEQDRVSVVRRIYKVYVDESRGFKSIADLLNREGIPSPRGPLWAKTYAGAWSLTTIRSLLMNPAYCGSMVWNRRTDARFHKIVGGHAVERKGIYCRRMEWNSEDDWIVVENAHEAIVSRRIWEKTRLLLKSKPESEQQRGINPRNGLPAGEPEVHRGVAWTGPRARFLLSGLITCPRCGSRYEGRVNYGKRSEDERRERKKTYVYACGGHIRHGKSVCSLGAVPQQVLEEAVINAVVQYYGKFSGPEGRLRIAQALDVNVTHDKQSLIAERRELDSRIKKSRSTIASLLDNLTAANRVHVDRRIVELEREQQEIEREREALDRMAVTAKELEAAVSETARFIACLEPMLREGPMDQRQAALRRCVWQARVQWDEGQIVLQMTAVPTCAKDQLSVADEIRAGW